MNGNFEPTSSSVGDAHQGLVESVVGEQGSTLVLWRGANAKRIALMLSCSHPHCDVRPLPSPRQMLEGFPGSGRTAESSNLYGAEADSANSLKGFAGTRRLIVCIAEQVAYWEIEKWVASTAYVGTPILLVTFRDTVAQVGPLIIGANTSAFFLSRLGLDGMKSHVSVSGTESPSASTVYRGGSSNEITRAISGIAKKLPDAQCFSVQWIDDKESTTRLVPTRTEVVQRRLQGMLWSVARTLDPLVANDPQIWTKAAAHIQSGRVLAIESAFKTEFAAAMHSSLSSSDRWALHSQQFPNFF